MNLDDAAFMVSELLVEHELVDEGWTFDFDRAVSRFGACNYTKKQITLSAALVELNNEDTVRNTALHEIAHALTPGDRGHGSEWYRVATSIGCTGERCYNGDLVTAPEPRYTGECGMCTHVFRRERKPKREAYCKKCSREFGFCDLTRITWTRNY